MLSVVCVGGLGLAVWMIAAWGRKPSDRQPLLVVSDESLEVAERTVRAAVVGIVDADGLTKPHAFVVPAGAAPDLADTLQAWVKERLEPYKYPRQVVLLEDLPRTHLGKVDRGQLRKL